MPVPLYEFLSRGGGGHMQGSVYIYMTLYIVLSQVNAVLLHLYLGLPQIIRIGDVVAVQSSEPKLAVSKKDSSR